MKPSLKRSIAVLVAVGAVVSVVWSPFTQNASAATRDGEGPATSVTTSDNPLGRTRRVLLFSVPTLTFRDLLDNDLPNLRKVFERSSIANLSTRTVYRTNTPGDGYGTLNAGSRTRGTPLAGLAFTAGAASVGPEDSEGDPTALPQGAFEDGSIDPEAAQNVIVGSGPTPTTVADQGTSDQGTPEQGSSDQRQAGQAGGSGSSGGPGASPGETYHGSGTPALEEFARRTGVIPPKGSIFNFGIVSMKALNQKLLFDSEIGALGNALEQAKVKRAVIANGDHGPGLSDTDFRREATLALMDSNGLVQSGRVGRSLLETAVSAPFGARYDLNRVAAAFKKSFSDGSVVLVEASDMVRSEDAKVLSSPQRQVVQRREALERSDELLGRLMADVDPKKDAIVVLSPYASGYDNGLTALGVSAPGIEAGLLTSGSTRRAGFIQTVDIAPTIISLAGAKTPTSMEGTVIKPVADSRSFDAKAQFLDDSYQAAVFRDDVIGAVSTFFVVIQLVLWLAAVWVMTRSGRRLGQVVQIAALAVLAYLPTTFVAGLFPFFRWGTAAYWAFLLGVSIALAVICQAVGRRYLVDPLMMMLGWIVAFLSADIVTGGALQFNTVFGYTPTVAGRFDGMGNPAYSMFSAAGIILAALVAYRIPARRGRWIAAALLVWILLVDGAPIWGADVGGALSLIPTFGIVILLLFDIRVKLRTAIWLAAATVGAVIGLAALDLMRPPTSRTHLGRLLSNTLDNGFGAFETVILRKLNANLSVLASSVWTLMLPLVFMFIALVFWRAPWRLRTISDEIPQQRVAVIGLSVAMVLGFALNDSGISVPGIMLGVISASLVHLMVRANSDPFVEQIRERDRSETQAGGEQSVLT